MLDGPDPAKLKPHVSKLAAPLINLLADKSVVVRDTVAWTLGRICELLPEAVLNDQIFPMLLEALVRSLEAEPRVAANICWVNWPGLFENVGSELFGRFCCFKDSAVSKILMSQRL